jgi:hypothetical protein
MLLQARFAMSRHQRKKQILSIQKQATQSSIGKTVLPALPLVFIVGLRLRLTVTLSNVSQLPMAAQQTCCFSGPH